MFTTDLRQFKVEMKALIDGVDTGVDGWSDSFKSNARRIIKDHKLAVSEDEYIGQLLKLMYARNKGRAHKLVDCFDDRALTRKGEALVWLIKKGFRLAILASFVVLVVWLYGRVAE
jgi:hypothetical protein